jgi:hypothetical protein
VNRRLLLAAAVVGAIGSGLAAPALAAGESTATEEPTSICVQMPLHKPTDPKAPGYCLWIPGLVAAR